METITMPVKGYTKMPSPYGDDGPQKIRFFAALNDVPEALTNWMSTNPREQNLTSSVAKEISESIHQNTKDFHLKNKGILLSAKEVKFAPASKDSMDGIVHIIFENPSLHGNIDGGHTLRLILSSHGEDELPNQFVEFEVMVGLTDLLPIAEARNTYVALDMRSMEEMKGSFEVLKSILSDVEIHGNKFYDRVEFKMNQQLEEQNHIDIRLIISILLMFNQDLFPAPSEAGINNNQPVQMYANREAALKKYLSLGDGDPERRIAAIRNMSPIMADIFKLWDTIERELPLVNYRKYSRLPFVEKNKSPISLFSNAPLKYPVPQSVIFPIIASFRVFVVVDTNGDYKWSHNPIDVWEAAKDSLVSSFFDTMSTYRNNPTLSAKKNICWRQYYTIALCYHHTIQ